MPGGNALIIKVCLGLVLACLISFGSSATAAISCSLSSPGFSASYTGDLSITQTEYTISCSRLSSDPNTSAYSVRPDNGINASAQQNRASFSSYTLNYEEYKSSGCNPLWHSGSAISGIINFGSALSVSTSDNFWGCIPAAQTYAAGTYIDTVMMTLTYHDGSTDVMTTDTHQVSIGAPPACAFTSAPGDVNFSYTAMQTSAANANTTFGITCTILTGVSMGLDPEGGVISGLNYQLRLNTTSSSGINPLGTTGIGVQQIFYINATMPAGQAGECSTGNCMDANNHTLTLTF